MSIAYHSYDIRGALAPYTKLCILVNVDRA